MKCRIWKRIALGSLVVCVVLGVAVLFIAMANKPYEIPYDGNNIVLEQQGDDYFVTYNGRGNLLLAYTCNNLDDENVRLSSTKRYGIGISLLCWPMKHLYINFVIWEKSRNL